MPKELLGEVATSVHLGRSAQCKISYQSTKKAEFGSLLQRLSNRRHPYLEEGGKLSLLNSESGRTQLSLDSTSLVTGKGYKYQTKCVTYYPIKISDVCRYQNKNVEYSSDKSRNSRSQEVRGCRNSADFRWGFPCSQK
jgi:hypothetical protein